MGRVVKPGINDMNTLRPDIAEMMRRYNSYHELKKDNLPDKISHSGKSTIFCRCEHGHDFSGIANKISLRKTIDGQVVCPFCKEKGIVKLPYTPRKTYKISLFDYCMKNNLNYLLQEWDFEKNTDKDPCFIGKSSKLIAWWKCPQGHEYQMRIAKRTEGHMCPICSSQKLLKGFNDLASQAPIVAKEWNYEKNDKNPDEYFVHANQKVWWKCSNGHEWLATINKRTAKNGGSGCPYCKAHGTSIVENVLYLSVKDKFKNVLHRCKIDGCEFDILIKDRNIAIEYNGVYYHTKKGKEDRDKRKIEIAKKNNLQFLRVIETNNSKLDNVYENGILYISSNKNIKYFEIAKTFLKILKENYSCNIDLFVDEDISIKARENIYCENLSNSLGVVYPDIAKEWHPTKNGKLTPFNVSKGSAIEVWWKCPNGHEYKRQVRRRTTSYYPCKCPICKAEHLR